MLSMLFIIYATGLKALFAAQTALKVFHKTMGTIIIKLHYW